MLVRVPVRPGASFRPSRTWLALAGNPNKVNQGQTMGQTNKSRVKAGPGPKWPCPLGTEVSRKKPLYTCKTKDPK